MDTKYIGKQIILNILTEIPFAGWIARQWDSIETDRRFKKIEQEITQIWEIVGNNPEASIEPVLYRFMDLIESNELVPSLDFRKTKSCMIFLREISNRSELGQPNDPVIEYDECINIVKDNIDDKDSERELKLVVYELEKKDLIYKHASGNSPLGFSSIGPKEYFFCKTDSIFQNWHPRYDAKEICNLGVNKDQLSVQEIDGQLKWGPRRLNSAIAFLHLEGLIHHDSDLGGIKYVLPWIRFTEEAYFFLDSDE